MIERNSKLKMALPLGGIVALLIVWQLIAWLVNDPLILPSPLITLTSAWQLLSGGYWKDLAATSTRAIAALVLALVIGIPLGLLLGWSGSLYDSFRTVLAFLRCLPAFMLIGIPIALGHGGETARILTTTAASAWIIADECAESLRTLGRDRIEVLQAFGASNFFVLTRLMCFEALGRVIVPAIKTNIGICFIVIIVVESLAIPMWGVGARLLTWMSAAEMPGVWGFLLLTGITGVVLNTLVHRTAKAMIFWS